MGYGAVGLRDFAGPWMLRTNDRLAFAPVVWINGGCQHCPHFAMQPCSNATTAANGTSAVSPLHSQPRLVIVKPF